MIIHVYIISVISLCTHTTIKVILLQKRNRYTYLISLTHNNLNYIPVKDKNGFPLNIETNTSTCIFELHSMYSII